MWSDGIGTLEAEVFFYWLEIVFRFDQLKLLIGFSHIEVICVDISWGCAVWRIVGYYRNGGFDDEAEKYATDTIECLRFYALVDELSVSLEILIYHWQFNLAPNKKTIKYFWDTLWNMVSINLSGAQPPRATRRISSILLFQTNLGSSRQLMFFAPSPPVITMLYLSVQISLFPGSSNNRFLKLHLMTSSGQITTT